MSFRSSPTQILRFGALLEFNIEDVDLKARRLRVRRSMTQVEGKLIEVNTKL